MTRVQDFALGAGICTLLLALVACAVQMVLEVLAVERDRRKDAGGGQSAGARHAAASTADALPPGVVLPTAREVGSAVRVGPVGSLLSGVGSTRKGERGPGSVWTAPDNLPDEVFAETVKRAHPDLTEWAS